MKFDNRLIIEFVVIVVIVAGLAYGATEVFLYGKTAANDEIRQKHLSTMEDALERYYYDHNAFPQATGAPEDETGQGIESLSTATNVTEALVQGGYLSEILSDPDESYGYLYFVADADNFEGGDKWQYYTLIARLENPDGPPFLKVGNAIEEFEISAETWNGVVAIAQTKDVVEVDGIRSESGTKISPDGGEGVFWQ
jgi:type II secretory pathway pseudopilin PulG